jgi:hypothetical protein
MRLFVTRGTWKNFVKREPFHRLIYYFSDRLLSELKFYRADSADID